MDESYPDGSQWQDDGAPWDEFKWEIFMREQDQRTVKYLERFAKVKDLPNCEELIARELSWDYDEDEEEGEEFECPFDGMDCENCSEKEQCEGYLEDDDEDGDGAEYDAPADFRRDPVWKQAYDLAIRLQYLSSSKLDSSGGRGPLFELLLNSRMIPAKIAGAFGIGFHVDALGGNIANHKRALLSALNCVNALAVLDDSGIIPTRLSTRFRKSLFDIREHLMKRIDELRDLFNKLADEK